MTGGEAWGIAAAATRWRASAIVIGLVVATAGPAGAARRRPTPPSPPPLVQEHRAPSLAFEFRTPAGWTVNQVSAEPETLDARGAGLRVRFVHRFGEHGYDSLHGACMLERLAPAMEMAPTVKYEYDYVSADLGNRRALDSAFVVRYDDPVDGHREWRQRNVTVVGGGNSLCAITYAPSSSWKKSPETRATLDAILGSLTFR